MKIIKKKKKCKKDEKENNNPEEIINRLEENKTIEGNVDNKVNEFNNIEIQPIIEDANVIKHYLIL